MEPHTTQYQVARKGQVIGVFSLHGLVEQLDTRQLNLEDHYWTEGMGDWQPLCAPSFPTGLILNRLKCENRSSKRIQSRQALL